MTPAQITTVQTSFAAVLPRADTVSRRFYERLFEAQPELRRLFPADLTEQRRKLMLTLASVVQNLHQIEAIMPAVRGLAVRHVGYGVQAAHYALVGRALLSALRDQVAGFDSEKESAWEAAYTALAQTMIAAASDPA